MLKAFKSSFPPIFGINIAIPSKNINFYTAESLICLKLKSRLKKKKLEAFIWSEVSQKDKHQHSIPTHIYGI